MNRSRRDGNIGIECALPGGYNHAMKYMPIIIVIVAAACLVALPACATDGGWIEWRREAVGLDGSRERETIRVEQPQSPADRATLERRADGGVKAGTPQSYKPADPPTPASKALGWLVWIGGVGVLLGGVLMVCRLSGWSVLAAAPKGVGLGLVIGGGALVAVAVAFDSNPLWSVAAAAGGVVVAVVVGFWDNIKQAMRRTQGTDAPDVVSSSVVDGGTVSGHDDKSWGVGGRG